jgi:sulfhydrogenase subunit beta (sulfur reductase)
MFDAGFLPHAQFHLLLDALGAAGYRVIGPRLRDGVIVYDTLTSPDDLPRGVHDHQSPGRYHAEKDPSDKRCFAWANGPQAIKPRMFAPREALWKSDKGSDGDVRYSQVLPEASALAIIGARACDLAALRLQDRHFLAQQFQDPHYAARRAQAFIVAVHCTHPAATCFCASTGDGPRAHDVYDLALSELDEGYIVEALGERGRAIAAQLPLEVTTPVQHTRARAGIDAAAACQTRRLPGGSLRDRLLANLEHPRWEDVAARCLSCGNCTSVCPTCFCSDAMDEPNLQGDTSVHVRLWGSCFTQSHSYIHGITIRPDTRTRYRQWLIHKLATWHDQYGRSGCVGCGRCITWCPTGIDITEEAAAVCGEVSHA